MRRRRVDADKLVADLEHLRDERDCAARRVSEINSIFERLGIAMPPKPAVADAPTENDHGPRKRRRRGVNQELILSVVRASGKRGAASSEITQAWSRKGRSGGPHTVLGEMVKRGTIKRVPNPQGRGYRYKLP